MLRADETKNANWVLSYLHSPRGLCIITAVKTMENLEEPLCHNVVGNDKRDGAKAEKS